MVNFEAAKENIRWICDPRNHAPGRVRMTEALRANDENRLGEVQEAFMDSQEGTLDDANFNACKAEDPRRLYGMATRVLVEHPEYFT